MARSWSTDRFVKHTRYAQTCLDCGGQIHPGESAQAVCGRDDEVGFWHGYIHPYCSVASDYEAYMDDATERYLTGGDVYGRDAAWEAHLGRLEGLR